MQGLCEVTSRCGIAVLGVVWVVLSSCSPAENPNQTCDDGRRAALRGDTIEAIGVWERKALDATPKEKLRAVLTCLRDSGLATSDADAARWVVDVADKSHGRAALYAGMLFASGAGLPADRSAARMYLEQARSAAPDEASAMLRVLDTAEQSTSK